MELIPNIIECAAENLKVKETRSSKKDPAVFFFEPQDPEQADARRLSPSVTFVSSSQKMCIASSTTDIL